MNRVERQRSRGREKIHIILYCYFYFFLCCLYMVCVFFFWLQLFLFCLIKTTRSNTTKTMPFEAKQQNKYCFFLNYMMTMFPCSLKLERKTTHMYRIKFVYSIKEEGSITDNILYAVENL